MGPVRRAGGRPDSSTRDSSTRDSGTGDSGIRYLVRMLYNGKETDFKPSCHPIAPGSYFYDFNEIQRCYRLS